jgi:hypothetical protein
VPDAGFAIDREIQARMHQVGHEGRRHGQVARCDERVAPFQRSKRLGDEVVLVPRPEEGARAHDQRARVIQQDDALGLGLAAAVHAQWRDGIGFDIRPLITAIEHEVARERR